MGPYYDWFGKDMTPQMLGYEKLFFINKNSEIIEFEKNIIEI